MVKGLSSINTEYSKRSKARKRRRDATLVHQFPEGWNPHAHIDKEIEENALKLFDVDDNNTEWEENLRKEAFKARPLDPWLHKEVPKTEEELIQERVEKDLKDWPWRDNSRQAVMLGPHMFNNNPSSAGDMRPPVSGGEGCDQKQSLFFTKIVANRDVFAQIMYLVCAHHDSAWKFGVTCIQAYNYMVRSCMGFWDMQGGWFDQCTQSREIYENGKVCNRSVKPVLIVAPTRHPEQETAKYEKQLRCMRQLCRAINNVHDSIQNIQFHNVPFLTHHMLALFIPMMRKLTTLGVYKCELIHVGHTMTLLDIITRDRPKGKECQVNLDFYPNFHKGPIQTGKPYEIGGSFGVTWDNWDRDSRLAIWQLVARILPQARLQGIDMESPWTAFRKWLEDGPCWRVEQTIKAIMSPTISKEEFAAQVDCGNILHYGSVYKMFKVKRHIQSEGMKWATTLYDCELCGPQLGIFFFYEQIRNQRIYNDPPRCHGCHITTILNGERDHFKRHKRLIIRKWLAHEQKTPHGNIHIWNSTDLKKAIQDYKPKYKDVHTWATGLDQIREEWIRDKGYDPEVLERQRCLTQQEMGRRGYKLRSPTVGMKREDPTTMDPEEAKWVGGRVEEIYAHGYLW